MQALNKKFSSIVLKGLSLIMLLLIQRGEEVAQVAGQIMECLSNILDSNNMAEGKSGTMKIYCDLIIECSSSNVIVPNLINDVIAKYLRVSIWIRPEKGKIFITTNLHSRPAMRVKGRASYVPSWFWSQEYER